MKVQQRFRLILFFGGVQFSMFSVVLCYEKKIFSWVGWFFFSGVCQFKVNLVKFFEAYNRLFTWTLSLQIKQSERTFFAHKNGQFSPQGLKIFMNFWFISKNFCSLNMFFWTGRKQFWQTRQKFFFRSAIFFVAGQFFSVASFAMKVWKPNNFSTTRRNLLNFWWFISLWGLQNACFSHKLNLKTLSFFTSRFGWFLIFFR